MRRRSAAATVPTLSSKAVWTEKKPGASCLAEGAASARVKRIYSMFDIGWGEMVVIGVVALVAIGPKELPGRPFGWSASGSARRGAWPSEFQGQFNEAMREAEDGRPARNRSTRWLTQAKGFSRSNILSSVTEGRRGRAQD